MENWEAQLGCTVSLRTESDGASVEFTGVGGHHFASPGQAAQKFVCSFDGNYCKWRLWRRWSLGALIKMWREQQQQEKQRKSENESALGAD